jgi:predicted transcriptional regulator
VSYGKLDERLAGRIEDLARWWTQATEKARYEKLREALAPEASREDFQALRAAIILAEIEAGQVSEG